ncbi:MAG: DUF559 domain-containing protein [Sporichthyaceae bacterium]
MDISSHAVRRIVRRRRIEALAASQGGVLSRRQLYGFGLVRGEVRAEIRAGRWRRFGRHTIRVAVGDERTALLWRAIFEVGPPAALDGVTALVAAGLRGVNEDAIHVAVPKSARPRRCPGVVVHETRRYEHSSVVDEGIACMRPATAAVHAALWARTDREAVLFVIAGAQQRLFSPEEFGEEVAKIRRDRRRRLLRSLYGDIAGGIEAIGERDFAALCAQRGFPEPTRQVRRRAVSGIWIYDTVWETFGVTVEINGVQHLDPERAMKDALKQNAATLDGYIVLQVPNLALRVDPEPFLDQVASALRRGGWAGPLAASA